MKLALNPTSPVPLYLQVKLLIRKEILEGTFSKGKRLPTMKSIEIENSLSRTTVERAYWLLEKEGYIKRKKGNGYFVPSTDMVGIDEFMFN